MLVPLTNTPRDYAWGSPTLIAELEGRTPTGAPEAEVWFGDHPGHPARVPDGRALGEWLASGDAPEGTPERLPYLLKILAASSSLSIQAHPSKEQAEAGFAREDADGVARDAGSRNYRDDNHKPEIIVAISDRFRALVGLRPLDQTRRLLATLGAGADPLRSRLTGEQDAEVLRAALRWALSEEARASLPDLVGAIRRANSEEFRQELDVLRRIADEFPGDGGLIVALLMNLVVLRRGEAVFAPAGVLHAYQDGLGVELMAASDNVLRGGLTPKHVDVEELMRVVDTTAGAVPLVEPHGAGELVRYDVGVPDFSLLRVDVNTGTTAHVGLIGPAIALCVAGDVFVAASGMELKLSAGQAVFVTGEPEVSISGTGEVFVAEPGR
ncbi:mannose-6-phosphate isomerase, class I [Microbacterium schleiferi]|uniref:mannose-6-phosphate isomerase, class I n=1 Tax=Microbacterium schleiferi TaxID=69362 RepID=UPI00311D6625